MLCTSIQSVCPSFCLFVCMSVFASQSCFNGVFSHFFTFWTGCELKEEIACFQSSFWKFWSVCLSVCLVCHKFELLMTHLKEQCSCFSFNQCLALFSCLSVFLLLCFSLCLFYSVFLSVFLCFACLFLSVWLSVCLCLCLQGLTKFLVANKQDFSIEFCLR